VFDAVLPHRLAQFNPARKTFIVHADEKLPAFLEVESVVRASDPSWWIESFLSGFKGCPNT
jgi:hypothetical protein